MVLQVNELEMKYKSKQVHNNITFSIGTGEIIGIVGPNGNALGIRIGKD
ncbi:MAG: hypothetical protein ABS960_07510 [Solibacillus isronensis]